LVNVREDWIGIRGVVGDDSTMDVLKGVTIKSMKHTIHIVTDSQGRFEFSLPRRERTSLTLSRDGYLTKPFVVPLDSTNSADVVVLMRRGTDPIFMKQALVDLEHRMAWGGIGMFVLDQNKLAATGELYLDAAIGRSGMLVRKGIVFRFPEFPGVFLDGQPSTSLVLGTLKVADIELVEVWAKDSDPTRSLASRWPGGGSRSQRGGGPWIAVWRKR
ncbi:MAG: carboxypeptidase-like regulatory domain-containing protein, partial [Phycisphaerae bacterium]|nr:carboxypeptidase-like regulatory domain-containing protein [Gemmatimonadaceae bacterium]